VVDSRHCEVAGTTVIKLY